jgi:hypothetical protein
VLKLAEYAESVGVVPQAVRKAIAEGRIKKGATRQGRSWLIDPKIANDEWGKNTAPQYRQGAAIKAGRQRQMAAAAANGEQSWQERERERKAGLAGMPTMAQAQTIKAAYQAKLTQLDFEERSGKLVSAEEMKRMRFESGRRVRDAVLRIGPQMIGEIAKAAGGLSQERRADVLLVIERHLVGALEALADGAGNS